LKYPLISSPTITEDLIRFRSHRLCAPILTVSLASSSVSPIPTPSSPSGPVPHSFPLPLPFQQKHHPPSFSGRATPILPHTLVLPSLLL
jgi:hypothetical protein